MEIIDELELYCCGFYVGVVGYIDFGGNMDICIVLWILVIKNDIVYV